MTVRVRDPKRVAAMFKRWSLWEKVKKEKAKKKRVISMRARNKKNICPMKIKRIRY